MSMSVGIDDCINNALTVMKLTRHVHDVVKSSCTSGHLIWSKCPLLKSVDDLSVKKKQLVLDKGCATYRFLTALPNVYKRRTRMRIRPD